MGGGGSQSAGESWSMTAPGFMAELGSVLQANLAGTTGFGKQDAINDVQGVMRQQATNALQEAMPGIASQQRVAGAYDSTTSQLLKNDLNARIMGQLAATQSQAIKDYAAIDADRIRAFAGATQAGTTSMMEHWESSKSRKGGGFLDELARGVVGGGLGLLLGSNESTDSFVDLGSHPAAELPRKPLEFANGGIVPLVPQQKSKSPTDRILQELFQKQIESLSPYFDPWEGDPKMAKPAPKDKNYKIRSRDPEMSSPPKSRAKVRDRYIEESELTPEQMQRMGKGDDDATDYFAKIGIV